MAKIYHVLIQMVLWTPWKAAGSILIIKRRNLEICSSSMQHCLHWRACVCCLYSHFALMEACSLAQQSYFSSSSDTDAKSSVPAYQVAGCLRSKYMKKSLDLQNVLSTFILQLVLLLLHFVTSELCMGNGAPVDFALCSLPWNNKCCWSNGSYFVVLPKWKCKWKTGGRK